MKKFYLLSALLLILVGCGPVRYQYRGSNYANSHVQERLDRRSYRLRIEQEVHNPRGNASRYGRGTVDIPDFVIAVNGERLHYIRNSHSEYRIANYRDTRNSSAVPSASRATTDTATRWKGNTNSPYIPTAVSASSSSTATIPSGANTRDGWISDMTIRDRTIPGDNGTRFLLTLRPLWPNK